VLERGPDLVQVGWDPDTAVVVEPPEGASAAALVLLLASLDGSRPLTELARDAARRGLAPRAWAAVLADLVAAGLVHGHRPTTAQRVHLHGEGPLAELLAEWLPGPAVELRRTHGRLPDWHGGGALPALVVLTDALVAEPRVVAELVAHRVPHLSVLVRDGGGLVGPLVLPARTACLRCADLHRRDLDPAWPLVAAQLLGRTGSARPAVLRATAALACAQVEAALADDAPRPPGSLGATLTVDLDGGGTRRRSFAPHPGCGCGAAR
jgi:bacteriocin biosynthesis cyclodehydratase domain-containing protein